MENAVTDEEFTYLNAYVEEIRKTEQAVLDRQAEYEEAAGRLEEAEKAYEDAKKRHTETLADLALAQADYDRLKPIQTATETSGTKKQQNENKKQTTSPKTGDQIPAGAAASMAIVSLAAGGAAVSRKRRRV